MVYRAEIDGLRAIAVLAVILYHAGFSSLSGGYIGVDVFFVISGYLITSILAKDLEKGNFSILNFYERRARRILPALTFVCLCSAVFAWWWLMPQDLSEFGKSLVATSLFASNVFFWLDSGYFSTAAELKPMLHTWSLAVEEQYYILFPILFGWLWKFGAPVVVKSLLIISIISLVSAELLMTRFEGAAFFLLPGRAWELLVGSLCALYLKRGNILPTNIVFFHLLGLIGLAMIAVPIFVYDLHTPFPGLSALPPVIGTALVILFAQEKTFTAQFLQLKPLVAVGLISYSAYLWHQPLFAFIRHRSIEEPTAVEFSGLVAVVLGLSYFTYRFVETPFRNRDVIGVKSIAWFSMAALSSLIIIGGVIGYAKGLDGLRFSDRQIELTKSAATSPKRRECHFPRQHGWDLEASCRYFFPDKVNTAFLGNSHSVELAYAAAEQLKVQGEGIVQHTMSGCRVNYKFDVEELDERQKPCADWIDEVVDSLIADKEINNVVVSFRNEHASPADIASFEALVRDLRSAEKRVVFVLQSPLLPASAMRYIFLHGDELKHPALSLQEWRSKYAVVLDMVEKFPSDVIVIDPSKHFCDKQNCFAFRENTAMYFDHHHMSVPAARLVAADIVEALKD